MSLDAEGEWSFAPTVVTITEDASFDDDGELNFNDSIILIDGNIDLSNLEDNLVLTALAGFGVHLGVLPGSQVTLTIDQHDAFDALYTVGEGSSVRIVGEGTVNAEQYVGKYVLAMDDGDVQFDFNADATDVDLTREGDDYVATLYAGAGIDDLSGDWDGFEDTDVLRIGTDVDVSEVNDGANLGGVGSLEYDLGPFTLSLTADQNEALRVAIEIGDGEILGDGTSTIAFTEVVDTSIGIEGIANYELYDDDEDNVGNVFKMAATDQRVVAGDQGDRLYANLGADEFELGAGDDEVVYDDAEQSLSITELDDTDAPSVDGADIRGQITRLDFVADQVDDQNVVEDWTYSIEIFDEGDVSQGTATYTVVLDDELGDIIEGLRDEVNGTFGPAYFTDGFSKVNRWLDIIGPEGEGNDFTVNVTVENAANVEQDAEDFFVYPGEDGDGEDAGTVTQTAEDAVGGSIEINITDEEAGMINGINLEYDDGTGFERLVDYNIDFDNIGGINDLETAVGNLGQIVSAVFDDGVLTITVADGESIQLADGYDSAFVTKAFDSVESFDDPLGSGDNVLDFSAFNFEVSDFEDIPIDVGAANVLYEAAVIADGQLDEGEFGFFEFGGDTYVYANLDDEDVVTGGDLMIQLMGNHNIEFHEDTGFVEAT